MLYLANLLINSDYKVNCKVNFEESASLFESIKHIDKTGNEYWSAREFAPYLGYAQWRNFESVLEKAKEAAKTASDSVPEHFADVSRMFQPGNGAERELADCKLSRYALVSAKNPDESGSFALNFTYICKTNALSDGQGARI